MQAKAPRFSMILAAGKGTRMKSASLHKVCFPIDGKPTINRGIEIYNACGISHHIVVVGALAGQVVETVGAEFQNVSFVYQAEQLGTAHATRAGMRAIEHMDQDEELLLVAGDRIIEAPVLEEFFDFFYSQRCDMAVLACPGRPGNSQGRIVETDDGTLLAIVEVADVRQRQVYRTIRERAEAGPHPCRDELIDILRAGFAADGDMPTDKKFAAAFGPLWQAVHEQERVLTKQALLDMIPEHLTRFEFPTPAGGERVKTPEEVDGAPLVNNSVYLVRKSALHYALDRLDRHNAQREEYLSGLVSVLAGATDGKRKFRLRSFRVDNPSYVMGYNDPAELLEVEAHIQSRQRMREVTDLPFSESYRPISDWQSAFRALLEDGRDGGEALWDDLSKFYGHATILIKERLSVCQDALGYAAEIMGPDEGVLIVRSPGRVNVMGRHIDHQGGHCNLMTIGYETVMVVHARADDRICLYNVDRDQFGTREFSIGELVMDLPWDDWLSVVNSDKVSSMVRTYGGDWSQYVMAAVLRLQKKFTHIPLRGMDIVVTGNVPMAAGLSSSSSLVVATAEATIAVNQLDTFPAQFVDLCGEGEWFVGTRGGSADHAAVKLGREGSVIKVTFFDFAVQDVVPFPEDYVLAVCDSGIKARKSATAKDQFNHRIACYRIGFELIRHYFPQYTHLLGHLRDVNVRTLGVPLSWIYRILLHLPEQATRDELRALLPDTDLDPFFATHQPPDDGLYPIRGVILFGLAECERARLYADLLKAGHLEEIGRMMNVSHDGDRVARVDALGAEAPFRAPDSNGYLLGLMEDLESGDPDRVQRAQLPTQPGCYHCSLPPLDRMVDISLGTDGVVGAQLAGAGLGGCMMVLAHRDAVRRLIRNLTEQYYESAGIPPAVLICRPIAGSGLLALPCLLRSKE